MFYRWPRSRCEQKEKTSGGSVEGENMPWDKYNHLPAVLWWWVEWKEPTKGHFTHKTESPWPLLHFKHSHWWPLQVRFHTWYAWGTNGVSMYVRMQDGCKVYMGSYMASNGWCFMVTWNVFQRPPLGGRPSTKPGDDGTPNAHNRWFIPFYHVWGTRMNRNSLR